MLTAVRTKRILLNRWGNDLGFKLNKIGKKKVKNIILFVFILASPVLELSAFADSIPDASQETMKPNFREAADTTKKGYAQVLLGPVFVTSKGGGTYFGWGAGMGYDLFSDHTGTTTVGLTIETISRDRKISGFNLKTRTTFVGIDLVGRHLFGSPVYLGGRFGIAPFSIALSNSSTDLSSSGSSFAVGPVLGVEVKVSDSVAIGLDLSYLTVGGGTVDGDLGSLDYDSSNAITTLGFVRALF
jgi:opacity protein-like surface antigen